MNNNFNKEDMVNICNDVKELVIYGIEGIIWILEKGKNLIEKISIE